MAIFDHVQSTGADSGSGTSVGLAFTSNNTAGNTLIVAARIGDLTQNPGISDSRGNSYTVIQNFETDGDTFVVWYSRNCAAGANTVTITNSSSVSRRWAIHEYEGDITLDQTAHAEGTGTTPNSGNVTTTVNDELIFGAVKTNDTTGFAAGASFTERQEQVKIATEDRKVSSTGSYAASMTLDIGTPNWSAIIATFKATVTTKAPLYRKNPMRHFLARQ